MLYFWRVQFSKFSLYPYLRNVKLISIVLLVILKITYIFNIWQRIFKISRRSFSDRKPILVLRLTQNLANNNLSSAKIMDWKIWARHCFFSHRPHFVSVLLNMLKNFVNTDIYWERLSLAPNLSTPPSRKWENSIQWCFNSPLESRNSCPSKAKRKYVL